MLLVVKLVENLEQDLEDEEELDGDLKPIAQLYDKMIENQQREINGGYITVTCF